MADPSTLLTSSVTNPDASAQVAALTTEAIAEALSGKVAASGVNPAIGAILTQLESGASIDSTSVLAQLAGLSQPINVFLQQLQSAVTTAKEGTTQGLLLSQQLQQGVITTAQFQAALNAIQLSQAQLTSLVANNVNASVAQLLTSLSSEAKLTNLPALLSSAAPVIPVQAVALNADGTPNNNPPNQGTDIHASGTPDNNPPTNAIPDQSIAFLNTVESPAALESDKNQEILSWFANLFQTAIDIAAANLEASLSSFASLKAQPKIMTGARAVVKINGKVSALCTGVSYEISSDWAEIKGVDELIPNDLAPLAYSIKGSMSVYRIPNGSPIGQFLTSDMFSSIIWPYTTIEIRDKRTDELIVLLKRVMITSQSESFRKGELTATNLTFVGIEFRDEIIPRLLPEKLTGDPASGSEGLIGTAKNIAGKIGDLFK